MRDLKFGVFEWPDWRKVSEAQKVCDNLPGISSLNYCEPDYLNGPAASPPPPVENPPGNKELPSPFPIEGECSIATRYNIDENDSLPGIDPPDGDPLSLYWAQEMIGADLLKEELKKTSPSEKRYLVEVFDTPTNNHDIHVKT